jgi:hypothetical protein
MSYFGRIAARARGGLGVAAPRGGRGAAGVVPAVASRSPLAQIDQRWNVPPVGLLGPTSRADGEWEGAGQAGDDIERVDEAHDPSEPTSGLALSSSQRASDRAFESVVPETPHPTFRRTAPCASALDAMAPPSPTSSEPASRGLRATDGPVPSHEPKRPSSSTFGLPAMFGESSGIARVIASTELSAMAEPTTPEGSASRSVVPSPTTDPVSRIDRSEVSAGPVEPRMGVPLEPQPDAQATLRKALSALDRWLTTPGRDVAHRRDEALEIAAPSQALVPSPSAYAVPSAGAFAPYRSEAPYEAAPAPPKIEIGRIDVQVVAPPDGAREPRRAPAPRQPFERTPFAYGWRQR